MSEVPRRSYFSVLSRRTGFKTDSLEKVYRIMAILERMHDIPVLAQKLALKGGTALHGLIFGFRRLSVDIDLNYIGSLDKGSMKEDRLEIRRTLLLLFKDLGYLIDEPVTMYAEEQFNVHYTNCGSGADKLKLEINYLERLPVLGTVDGLIKHPYQEMDEVAVLSYYPEELFAGKVRALMMRGTPRDLYDSYLISGGSYPFDPVLLRKLVLFYLRMSAVDVRDINLDIIDKVTEKDIRNILLPMLPRPDVPNLSLMKEKVREIIGPILVLNSDEKKFFDSLYEKGIMHQEFLFDEIRIPRDLSVHPGIVWRLMQIKRMGIPGK